MRRERKKLAEEIPRQREVELYRNASFLFNKNGYAVTSMRQICRAIGIRESSLYHYIKGKEKLLYNICRRSMLQSLEAIEPIVHSPLRSDLKLRKMIETHIINLTENIDGHGTMLKELRSLSPRNKREIIKLRDRYEAFFRKIIADCVKGKFYRPINVKMANFALLGMMNWLMQWFSGNGPMKSKDIARIYSDLFFKGLPRRDRNSKKGDLNRLNGNIN